MVSDQQPNGSGVSLDRETKSKIKRWVLALRAAFEKDFALQLRRLGIEVGKPTADPPSYLTDEEMNQRQRILALIRREQQAEGTRDKAVEAYVRDCTFTIINRLVGLRCMEARELLIVDGRPVEVITVHGPTVHGGRPSLLAQMREEEPQYRSPADGEERLWRDALQRACVAVSEDIKVLFDPDHEFSILFPAHATLMEAVRAINEDLPPEVYRAPDFLGWVYQFFNAEEKVAIREATKGKPRNSHELAVINQFYTPDWIAKFLVDNTLGRVWLQMHPDTRLYWRNRIGDRDPTTMTPEEKRQIMFQGVNIDYLVPDTGETDSIPAKPVSEITLLDPACGTMHFGQYAYAIFYGMYLEEGVVPPADIPNAIVGNNLFGVDIDPRAIQIAALTLLLTMKERARLHGLDPTALRVRKMNLVCANSVNLGGEEREKLLERLDPDVFGGDVPMKRAVEALWENLEHVGELGSLIQVDESVQQALSALVGQPAIAGLKGQTQLDPTEDWATGQKRLTTEQVRTASEELVTQVQQIASGKGNGDIMAQLFAQETEKGLRLLEVLGRTYDVVLMNPPYGAFTDSGNSIAKRLYPKTFTDAYAAFMERATELCERYGTIGMLTQRNFLFLSSFEALRRDVIASRTQPLAVLDLGFDVLDDATARYAAVALQHGRGKPIAEHTQPVAFVRLTDYAYEDALGVFEKDMVASDVGDLDQRWYRVSIGECSAVPRVPFSYWLPDSIRSAFRSFPPLDPDHAGVESDVRIAEAHDGLGTRDNDRFLRQIWELSPHDYRSAATEGGAPRRWFPFVKGSNRYFTDLDVVVNWENDGYEIRNWRSDSGQVMSRPRGMPHYFRPGIAWQCIVTSPCLDMRRVRAGAIVGDMGRMLFPYDSSWEDALVAWGNSRAVSYLFSTLDPLVHHRAVGYVARLPIPPLVIASGSLDAGGRTIRERLEEWDSGNEISTLFRAPWALHAVPPAMDQASTAPSATLSAALAHCMEREREWSIECQRLQNEIDGTVYDLYQITPEDRVIVERELGDRPEGTVWTQMAGKSREEKRLEHVLRLLSYLVKGVSEEDDDGIVPLVPCGDETTLVDRARARLDELFGADRGHEIEVEINNELRVRIKGNKNCGPKVDMEAWFATRYFDYHVGLYKHRPIFWHITSADGSFGVLVHYHRFNRNRLQKLRASYLATFRDRLRREIGDLQSDDRREARARLEKLEGNLRSAEDLEAKLGQILTGDGYPIQVPWKSEDEQPKGWDPDIDDGVKVNIGPFQAAGVLAVRKVV